MTSSMPPLGPVTNVTGVGDEAQIVDAGAPIVTYTSGFPDLDAAAIKVAKSNRYAAGTESGVALAESCFTFKVNFALNNH
jgi:hypothetical protein